MSRIATLLTASMVVVATAVGCDPGGGVRAAVSLKMARVKPTPPDASVYIDEQYVGPLGYVARRGVRLPLGKHRVTVEREGYFPWDRLVEADRAPILLEVELQPVPD